MTNHWIDYQHSDVVMAIGVNTAENHPVSMKWIERARAKGGKLIAVDPRFTRTAAKADMYVPLRPGTDIAFLNGLINYALQSNLYNAEFVANYTNAPFLVNPNFWFRDGQFAGLQVSPLPWDPDFMSYDRSSWSFQTDENGEIRRDNSLRNPNSVWQLFKEHMSRYTPEMVSSITGMSVQQFTRVADLFCSTSAPGRAGNILYAMGITQHTYGSQNVRAIAILQTLLGNVGIAGGGVNAQRGESNVQGSTDMAQLFHILPGYLPMIRAAAHPTLADYIAQETPRTSYWTNRSKFLVSLLKAWWGDEAHRNNDFAYDYLPKLDGRERSHPSYFEYMAMGEIQGLFAWGQNPAVGGPNTTRERAAMANLEWLVTIDLWETETAAFWKAPGVDPSTINTEVFLLPAACSFEKEGSVSNSGRWIQWRYEAVSPPGEAKSDLWIADKLYKAIRREYEAGGVFPDPLLKLNWDYGGDGYAEPDIERVALEINGYEVGSGRPLLNFTRLADTGTTACGNWIYSGYYNDPVNPPTKRRVKETSGIGTNPDWSFAWPLNRRIIYNRCSARPDGSPWDPRAPVVWWENGAWRRNDVPDFGWVRPDGSMIPPEVSAAAPFIMAPDLKARFFASGMADGPFPEHYEPMESPVVNAMSSQQVNPARRMFVSEANKLAETASSSFPFIATTYRVTEHWQSGIMTRNSPWLNELMPDMFCEISPGLASQQGISNGDDVVISTARGEITVVACVTPRMKPLTVNGSKLEIVGMAWHWGYCGKSTGAVANDITPLVGDANTSIPEYKAFLCNVRRAT